MYCPECRDEFRPGFTRCRACDIDLVESLDDGEARAEVETVEIAGSPVPQARPQRSAHESPVNFCGFLALEDARQAKTQLGDKGIDAEILIKDATDGREEFWLRVRPSDFRATQDLLGYDESSAQEEERVLCAACETLVSAEGDRCPHCGAPFEAV